MLSCGKEGNICGSGERNTGIQSFGFFRNIQKCTRRRLPQCMGSYMRYYMLIHSPWIWQLIMKQRIDEGFNEKNQTLIKNGPAPSTKDTAGKCVLLKFGVRRCTLSWQKYTHLAWKTYPFIYFQYGKHSCPFT